MTKSKAPKSWAEQLADLDDPAPKDFDPEDDGRAQNNHSSDEGSTLDLDEGRQQYEEVGKSEFRKPEPVTLGPQYTGARISRDALDEDESDDEPFGKAAEEDETSEDQEHETPDIYTHRQNLFSQDAGRLEQGVLPEDNDSDDNSQSSRDTTTPEDLDQLNKTSSKASERGHTVLSFTQSYSGTSEDDTNHPEHSSNNSSFSDGDEDSAMEQPSASDTDSESDISSASGDAKSPNGVPSDEEASQRAQIRKMMAESQKNVLSNISAAAKADAAKGKAIKKQRSTFDSLLNTRIKLQKALVATNSLAMNPTIGDSDMTDPNEESLGPRAIEAAERAALNLWNTIDSLRHTLHPQTSSSTPHPPATPSTSTSNLWTRTHAHDTLALPNHRSTLTKWSNRINPSPLLSRSKFSQAPTQQPLTSVLDQQLTGTQAQKHLDRARTPRSCAPLQAAKRVIHDGGIYDDADFYTVLLRELVEQRMADGSSSHASVAANNGRGISTENGNGNDALPLLPGMKDRALRVKKNVDTKASKGRKMRYTVHEKLQNFMAPEDRGAWGERQRAELFSGLLGRRVEMGEEMDVDGEGEDGDVDMEARREEEALMLFRR